MKDNGIVQGSSKFAVPVYYGKNHVYVHSNITQVLEDSEGNPVADLYSYNEVQYTTQEYAMEQAEILNILLGV